jgi:hypothetical protein
MPEEKVFGFRLEAARSKVRYGRAVLIVQRSGVVVFTPVTEKLEEHRRGRAAAEDVAWTFARTRVVEQSPSFDWAGAEIHKMLPLVTAVTEDPQIEARTPAALVPELEALEEKELKELDADRRRFAELSAVLPEMSELDLSELTSSGVTLSRKDGSNVSDATGDWRQIEKQIQLLFRPENIADPIRFFEVTKAMLDSERFARLSTATGFTFSATLPAEVWPELEALIKQVEDPTFVAVIRHGMEALEKKRGAADRSGDGGTGGGDHLASTGGREDGEQPPEGHSFGCHQQSDHPSDPGRFGQAGGQVLENGAIQRA